MKTSLLSLTLLIASLLSLSADSAVSQKAQQYAQALGLTVEAQAREAGITYHRLTEAHAGITLTHKKKEKYTSHEATFTVYKDSAVTLPILFALANTLPEASQEKAEVEKLQALAQMMQDYPHAHFLLEGHSCDLGKPDMNLVLSYRRAETVKGWLMALGIDGSRLQVSGVGEQEAAKSFSEKDLTFGTELARLASRKVTVRQLAK